MQAVDRSVTPGSGPSAGGPSDDATFGARLTRLRTQAGLSQAELAGDDLSASYVSLLEAGKRRPSSDVVTVLAERLNCSPSMLMDGQQSERERRVELELAYCRLALTHGEKESARDRLLALLAEESLGRRVTDEGQLLLATAYEHLGDRATAVLVMVPIFERVLRGESHLPVTDLGMTLASYYIEAGDFRRAVEVGEQAFRVAVEHGLRGTDDYFRLASTLMWAYHEAGDVLHAATWGQALIDEAGAQGSATGQGAIYWNAALVAESQGRIDEALVLSQRALAKMSESGDSRDLGRLRVAIAQLMLVAQPPLPDEALRILEQTRESLLDLGSRNDRAVWSMTAAGALLLQDKPSEAAAHNEVALQGLDALDDKEAATALLTAGDICLATQEAAEGVAAYRRAAAALSGGEQNRSLARLWRDLADRLLDAGEQDAAVQGYRQALDGVGVKDRTSELRTHLRRLAAGAHRRETESAVVSE